MGVTYLCSKIHVIYETFMFTETHSNFSGRYCFGLRLFFFFFVTFAGALSLEWLDGSQLIFRQGGGVDWLEPY